MSTDVWTTLQSSTQALVIDESGLIVADCGSRHDDAGRIVRAVNHHADLVQALRAIVEEATHLRSPSVDLLRAAETARVALAKLDAQS